jgi:ParB-like chromosome segregation protein Spo0J
VEAAKILGMSQVPTIRLENLNEDQIRAYIIADNKLAENAGWDKSSHGIQRNDVAGPATNLASHQVTRLKPYADTEKPRPT